MVRIAQLRGIDFKAGGLRCQVGIIEGVGTGWALDE